MPCPPPSRELAITPPSKPSKLRLARSPIRSNVIPSLDRAMAPLPLQPGSESPPPRAPMANPCDSPRESLSTRPPPPHPHSSTPTCLPLLSHRPADRVSWRRAASLQRLGRRNALASPLPKRSPSHAQLRSGASRYCTYSTTDGRCAGMGVVFGSARRCRSRNLPEQVRAILHAVTCTRTYLSLDA